MLGFIFLYIFNGADTQNRTGDLTLTKGALYRLSHISINLDDLRSNLKAWQCPTLTWRMPHYHRRYSVSLLCSEWIQVVPLRYCRQAYSVHWKANLFSQLSL